MRSIAWLIFLASSVAASLVQCPDGIVQFPLGQEVNGTWPESQPQPITSSSTCYIVFNIPSASILHLTFNTLNLDPKTIIPNGKVMNVVLNGTGVTEVVTPGTATITIDGAQQNTSNAAFSIFYSYHEITNPLFSLPIVAGVYQQTELQLILFEFSFTLTSNTSDNLHYIIFLAYYGEEVWDYGATDCLAFYAPTGLITSGNDIVMNNNGVWEFDVANVTVFQSRTAHFGPILGIFGYQKPTNSGVDWSEYTAKAWETKKYEMDAENQPIFVFMRQDNGKYDVVSNIISTGGDLTIYEGFAEILPNGTVNGNFVANFNKSNTLPPSTFVNLTYTFYVNRGKVSFQLSEIPGPTTPQPSTTTTSNVETSTRKIPTTTKGSLRNSFVMGFAIILSMIALKDQNFM
ncbi:unnamed protein product [Caenorhabditis auriculariae]|uniref:DUF7591 domain-containing protein n=1 Tax=Caenorhabditis auriculariae TaxID=2777116 RepID=A0A8S1HVB4_9PELO|nr:unnamed protein product [Caenorhabditis auriculariae]